MSTPVTYTTIKLYIKNATPDKNGTNCGKVYINGKATSRIRNDKNKLGGKAFDFPA